MAATENRKIYIWINGKEVENSVKGISAEYRKNRAVLQHLNRDTKEYQDQIKNIRTLKGHLDDHRNQLNGVSKSWNLMKQAAAGVFAGNIMTAAMQKVTSFIPDLIGKNAELSDSMTDVQKTTNLTDQQMKKLMGNFKAMNTRTARKELLALAAEAGKMGYRGVDAISQYVEQTNELVTALGDDLGEGAGLKVAKMADLFDVSMRKIGSGINAAADNSKANAGFLTEFLSRLAGVGKVTNIAAGDILGYGTAIDEMGLNVEMSSTALNGFLIDFTKNTESFGKAAGFAEGELTALVGNQGTNAGFLAFLERLKATNPEADQFLRKLEDIGINGDRGSQVFLALSQNIEKVRERQALANSEIEKGTSITNEYQKRNNNLAADLEKLGKQINSWFANSGLTSFLGSIVSAMADTRTEAQKLSDAYNEQVSKVANLETELNPLVERYKELKEKGQLSREEHQELKAIIDKITEIMPAAANEWDKYNRVIGINTDLVKGNIETQREVAKLKNKAAIKAETDEIERYTRALENSAGWQKSELNNLRQKQAAQNALSQAMKDQLVVTGRWKDYEQIIAETMARSNEGYKLANIEVAERTLNLHNLGVELTKEQMIMVDSVLGTNHFNLVNKDLNATMAKGVMDMSDYRGEMEQQRQTLEDLKKALEDNVKAREDLAFVNRTDEENKRVETLKAEGTELEKQIKALEIALGLRKADAAHQSKHATESLAKIKMIYQQQKEIADAYREEQRLAMLTEYELLEEDYENRLISYQEFLDRKTELDMAEEARKRAEQAGTGGTISDPSNFLEWIASDRADELLGKVQQGYATAQQLAGSYMDIMANYDQKRLNDIDRIYNAEAEWIQKLKDSKMISEESYAYQKEKLDKEREEKEKAIQLRAWKRGKAIAISTASINTALAVMNALATVQPMFPAGVIAATGAGVTGGLQIAAIASEPPPQFALGTVLNGPSHRNGGMPIINPITGRAEAEVEGGEVLLTKGVSGNPRLLSMASALNVAAGGRALVPSYMQSKNQRYFEDGGIMPSAAQGGQMANDQMLDELRGLRQELSQLKEVRAVLSLDSIDKGYEDRGRADAMS
jgi:TP901 family phage tail tape measure protein